MLRSGRNWPSRAVYPPWWGNRYVAVAETLRAEWHRPSCEPSVWCDWRFFPRASGCGQPPASSSQWVQNCCKLCMLGTSMVEERLGHFAWKFICIPGFQISLIFQWKPIFQIALVSMFMGETYFQEFGPMFMGEKYFHECAIFFHWWKMFFRNLP